MIKSKTYFEQVPLETVKNIVEEFRAELPIVPPVSRLSRHGFRCRICRKPVSVETAKTNSYGQAVHEECYVASVTSQVQPGRPSY